MPDHQTLLCGAIPNTLLCEEDVILDLLASLDTSKSTGPDNISALMLKQTAANIAPLMTLLFNQSLKQGKIQVSHVVPIPKVSPAKSPDNFRPISPLSILSNVLERHVYALIADHLDSVVYQIVNGDLEQDTLLFLHSCQQLHTGSLYLRPDGKCVPCFLTIKRLSIQCHIVHYSKKSSLNLDPFLIRWVADYLTLRYQDVIVEGEKSTGAQVLSGVPQSSVLGPLLFLIYVNGINNFSLSLDACSVTFADDVCIYQPTYTQLK